MPNSNSNSNPNQIQTNSKFKNNRFVDAAEHRYVLSAKVADAGGEAYVNLFNKEVTDGGV